jgi:hypothetical protein
MITEQKQEASLRPFRILMGQFESELTLANQALSEWNKARSISASSTETPNNGGLTDKIQQLEKGKEELEKFIAKLTARMELPETDHDVIIDGLQSSYSDFTIMFHEAQALLNYGYTVTQKNEINRRITAINSSRMLNNADMLALQTQWTNLLRMKNDGRLALSKKVFESRLSDWETLIAKKNR